MQALAGTRWRAAMPYTPILLARNSHRPAPILLATKAVVRPSPIFSPLPPVVPLLALSPSLFSSGHRCEEPGRKKMIPPL